ncbi:MAG: transcription elongation factor NusA [Hadesarchaea archaeon]|nr:MAG: transcription elongation factor NusA [Hadesarchaea archaeon]
MLGVTIDRIEEQEGEIVVYVPKNQIAKAIGSNGSVVRAAELVLNKKLSIKESGG